MSKVLIAEDDTYLSNAYRVKFSKAGYDVKVASDGEELLHVVQSFSPDVILLDLIMPRKNGFDTLVALKADAQLKSIPVVITSNLGQKEDIDRAMKLGATEFIVKTEMTLAQIIEKVNGLIKA